MNLPDTDPAAGRAEDFTCKHNAYDGHDGVDVVIADRAAMEAGVTVVAAAAGTVKRVRDGETDAFRGEAAKDEVRKSGRECGNGILIEHENGWTTQYCHLKQGSITVKGGDAVKAGQAIAKIGLSGITDHPHVHLTVRKQETVIDPFTGRELRQAARAVMGRTGDARVPEPL